MRLWILCWLMGRKSVYCRVGVYRPLSFKHFLQAFPSTVQTITVLDRTKEAGATGDPLYLDVVNAIQEGLKTRDDRSVAPTAILGGRYGLSSKEFTPSMVKAVYENGAPGKQKDHFTVGIEDDVSHSSLAFDPEFSTESAD